MSTSTSAMTSKQLNRQLKVLGNQLNKETKRADVVYRRKVKRLNTTRNIGRNNAKLHIKNSNVYRTEVQAVEWQYNADLATAGHERQDSINRSKDNFVKKRKELLSIRSKSIRQGIK
jgi:hypothetical protein